MHNVVIIALVIKDLIKRSDKCNFLSCVDVRVWGWAESFILTSQSALVYITVINHDLLRAISRWQVVLGEGPSHSRKHL